MEASKDSTTTVHSHCILSGYLLKMKQKPTKFLPVWNRRWFVLESHALKWYMSENNLHKESGVIPLTAISSVKVFERNESGATSLVVHSSCRSLLLRAENTGKADTWVRAIRLQLNLTNDNQQKGSRTTKQRPSRPGDNYEAMDRHLEYVLEGLDELAKQQRDCTDASIARGNAYSNGVDSFDYDREQSFVDLNDDIRHSHSSNYDRQRKSSHERQAEVVQQSHQQKEALHAWTAKS